MHGDHKHYYNALKKNGNFISSVITVSDYLKDQVTTLKHDSPNKLRFTISSIKFPVPNVEKISGIESRVIRLAFVGSLSESKGVLKLKTIIDQLEHRNVQYHLNIIGSGEEKQQLLSDFKENPNVTLIGTLSNDDVIKSHEKHDVLLLPSNGEGLPVVVVEAMKCETVPITTDLKTGIPELIEHGINGYTVSLKNINKYADYIEILYNDRNKLSEMSKKCRVKANDMFDPIQQTKAYEENFASAPKIKFKTSFVRKMYNFLPITIEHRLKKYYSEKR
jgi:glycosyltransferase involved in cell wall biosynthesis